jgi:hypothetical protein
MAKRKRRPGGGRKPLPEQDKLAPPFSVRLQKDLRRQLDAAAKKSGHSVGWEMQRRLKNSFDIDAVKARDPSARRLGFLLAEFTEGLPKGWHRNRFTFRAFRTGFAKLLAEIEPAGKITMPRAINREIRRSEKSRDYGHRKYGAYLRRKWASPERLGRAIATTVLKDLRSSKRLAAWYRFTGDNVFLPTILGMDHTRDEFGLPVDRPLLDGPRGKIADVLPFLDD